MSHFFRFFDEQYSRRSKYRRGKFRGHDKNSVVFTDVEQVILDFVSVTQQTASRKHGFFFLIIKKKKK